MQAVLQISRRTRVESEYWQFGLWAAERNVVSWLMKTRKEERQRVDETEKK